MPHIYIDLDLDIQFHRNVYGNKNRNYEGLVFGHEFTTCIHGTRPMRKQMYLDHETGGLIDV